MASPYTHAQTSGHVENMMPSKIFIFTRMNISGSKTKGNNKLTSLTININSQHIQRDEVGDTWNYTEQNNLWLECHTVQLPHLEIA